jgi:peroxiredoxin
MAFGQGNVTIRGKVIDREGQKVSLQTNVGIEVKALDSTVVTNSSFSFTIPANEAKRIRIKVNGLKPIALFITEYGEISLEEALGKLRISKHNAPEQQIQFELLSAQLDSVQSLRWKLFNEYNTMKDQQNEQGMEDVSRKLTKNGEAAVSVLKNFLQKNINSPVAIYALLELSDKTMDQEEMESFIRSLPESSLKHPTVKVINQRIANQKTADVGNYAPSFSQTNPEGKLIKLEDYRGKYVLIDFWASWCGPCRKENPNLVKAYNEFHAKGFTIISVSLDKPKDKQKWIDAIAKDRMQAWLHTSDLNFFENSVAKLYGIQAIPQNFLVDKSGKIIAKDLRGENLVEALKKVISN